jgi:hypothetical protein
MGLKGATKLGNDTGIDLVGLGQSTLSHRKAAHSERIDDADSDPAIEGSGEKELLVATSRLADQVDSP